jgi:hypothetical protein
MLLTRLVLATLAVAFCGWAQAPQGRWDGTITFDKTLKVPFTLFFEGTEAALTGSLVNGDVRVQSSAGVLSGGTLRLKFPQSGLELDGTLANGQLNGTLRTAKYGERPFTAAPYCTCSFDGDAGPDIAGSWQVSDAGWRIAIRRVGEDTLAEVSSALFGKMGPLSGRFDGIVFSLRYFDGTRAALLEIEPAKDGGLDLLWRSPDEGTKKLRAVRVKGD